MYNPELNEYYNEWIELYNPTNNSINISGWSITDNRYKDYIEPDFDHGNGTFIIPSKSYAILTDHGTKIYEHYNFSNETIFLYIDDKSIGNGLGNSGDKLILKNKTDKIIDYVEWIKNYSDVPGNPIQETLENYTISKIKPKNTTDSKNDYYEGIPTPGRKNILLKRGKTKIDTDETEFLISKNKKQKIYLEIQNLGDFSDNVTIEIKSIRFGWRIKPEKKKIYLEPNEKNKISFKVYPYIEECYEGSLELIAKSEKKINETDEIKLNFKIRNPDLFVKKIKIYNETKEENNIIKQGEIIRVKSFLKNLGIDSASNVIVTFYLDEYKRESRFGEKIYESVERYQKYLWFYRGILKIISSLNNLICYG